jgi:hypothetical protein
MKRNNEFSHIPEINAVAEWLYTTAAGAEHPDCALTLENFAFQVGEILTKPAPCRFRLHFSPHTAIVEIKPSGDKAPGEIDVWDQVTINGVGCGNRCGGRDVYAAMVRPFLGCGHDEQSAQGRE